MGITDEFNSDGIGFTKGLEILTEMLICLDLSVRLVLL